MGHEHPKPEPDPPWQDRAACRGLDPNLFVVSIRCSQGIPDCDEAQALVDLAKEVCATCPVRDECLDWAISIRDRWSVLGGLTPPERRALIATRANPTKTGHA